MSDDLTAAGEALHVRRHPGYPCELLAGGSCQLQRDIRAIEQAAAARAVDEALSVEALVAALRSLEGTTRDDFWAGWDDTAAIAAALVAHLRGHR